MSLGSITIADGWMWFLAFCAGLVSIAKAWEILKKILHPEADLRETVGKMKKYLEDDERRLKALETDQANSREFESIICRVMLAQLNHELSGNDISRLKDARDELQVFLTNR